LAGNASRTRFTLELSRDVRAEVFTLAEPYRVIVDLPQVAFRLREADGRTGRGLVSAFRYGQFDADKGRVVLDTTPGAGESTQMQLHDVWRRHADHRTAPIDAASFGTGTGA
jgi:N-acetylmuramoyl-L-alanine amidase